MSGTSLYDVLGISRSATQGEIRREYHKLAKKYHPDKNSGNEDKFKEIEEAYSILSDPEKRGMYDRFGIEAVKGESSGGMGDFPFGGDSIFSHIFGGGGDMFGFGGGRRRRRTKGETLGIPLEVSLEELYNGATKSVEYKRKELCRTCKGAGSVGGKGTSSCSRCKGSGIQVKLHQIGPGMMQQTQAQCSDCNGSGDFIREKDRCKKCKGKRVFENNHKLEVQLTPGMKHEQKIPFAGQADQVPDGDAGDVIVVLQQEDHPVFRRDGLDLYVKKTINLQQALCGFSFMFEHLDGRKMKLTCNSGEVLSPNCIRGLEEEGMPDARYGTKGNLYFEFDVKFPENNFLDSDKLHELEKLLPARPNEPLIDDDMEEVHMADFDESQGNIGGGRGGEVYNEGSDDEEFGGHGHRVGCQQQ